MKAGYEVFKVCTNYLILSIVYDEADDPVCPEKTNYGC
jgi:hypothetical protein